MTVRRWLIPFRQLKGLYNRPYFFSDEVNKGTERKSLVRENKAWNTKLRHKGNNVPIYFFTDLYFGLYYYHSQAKKESLTIQTVIIWSNDNIKPSRNNWVPQKPTLKQRFAHRSYWGWILEPKIDKRVRKPGLSRRHVELLWFICSNVFAGLRGSTELEWPSEMPWIEAREYRLSVPTLITTECWLPWRRWGNLEQSSFFPLRAVCERD